MKYKVVIENCFGKAEFEFTANTEEEYLKETKRYQLPNSYRRNETIYVVGVDTEFFEQII